MIYIKRANFEVHTLRVYYIFSSKFPIYKKRLRSTLLLSLNYVG